MKNLKRLAYRRRCQQEAAERYWEKKRRDRRAIFMRALADTLEPTISDAKNFDWNNTDEDKIIEANYISAYKGVLYIIVPFAGQGLSFGVVFFDSETTNENRIKHEYGHVLQLKEMGVYKYTTDVAIPSLTANILRKLGKLPYDYYGSPWESDADEKGGVERTTDNTPWPEDACDSYWDLIKLFFE